MTRQEQIELLNKISDAICGIFDGIADEFDEDSDIYDSIVSVEHDIAKLQKSLLEGECDENINYYEYMVYDYVEGSEEKVVRTFDYNGRNAMMNQVSKTICFSDCTDERITKIVYKGREVEYTGWEPGMVMNFKNKNTGEFVWGCCHPEWDH